MKVANLPAPFTPFTLTVQTPEEEAALFVALDLLTDDPDFRENIERFVDKRQRSPGYLDQLALGSVGRAAWAWWDALVMRKEDTP